MRHPGEQQPIIIVQGAQYGSEGKGGVAAALCKRRDVDYAVRTGAINAGHTVEYKGKMYKMQQLPTGWVNPNTKLVIGPGAYVHLATLTNEIKMVSEALGVSLYDVMSRIYVDYRAGIHHEFCEVEAKLANRHLSIGATGKGCAEAILNKIQLRGKATVPMTIEAEWMQQGGINGWIHILDTVDLLNTKYDDGYLILIEGTQGALLDLHQGPYPYVTSRMTSAANWVAEAGLSPNMRYEVILVARTYPIRVAGNSGPMPHEISWPILLRRMNLQMEAQGLGPLIDLHSLAIFEECVKWSAEYKFDYYRGDLNFHEWPDSKKVEFRRLLSGVHTEALKRMEVAHPDDYDNLKPYLEFTTVTKKLRRVSEFDFNNFRAVVKRERPHRLVLTFANYIWPEMWGWDGGEMPDHVYKEFADFQAALGIPIDYATWGPNDNNFLEIHSMPQVDSGSLDPPVEAGGGDGR